MDRMQGRSLRVTLYIGSITLLILLGGLIAYAHAFGPAGTDLTNKEFVITPDDSMDTIAARLADAGLIKNEWAFRLAYLRAGAISGIRPGGYEIAPSMDAWTVASTLAQTPYLAWVVIPPGLRKEQIGELLGKALSWNQSQKQEWNTNATSASPDYAEGVYYPDTYLIPSDQTPAQVAARIRDRFTQVFTPYANLAAKQNVKWTSVLTVASLIEREAAGPDMQLISGIIWNRLKKNMALQIDASLQYVKGSEGNWWPIVKSEDKYLDSPFNTYQHTGLPPHPIANPPLAAIAAALNPTTTKCLYYLHDNHGLIHCSPNYAGQLANVNKYLK